MNGDVYDGGYLAQACVHGNHRINESMQGLFSKPLLNSNLLVDMAEPESRGGTACHPKKNTAKL